MKYIDQENWPRREHYRFFSQFDYPQFSLCANVDITSFFAYLHENGISFFAGFLYVSVKAANTVPEFRRRIRGDQVVEHGTVHPSATILLEDETFAYLRVPFEGDLRAFARAVKEGIAEIRQNPSIEDEPGMDDLLYITSLPWVSFTSLTHPIQLDAGDSIPRISWGKYFKNGDRLFLPLSVQVHHALMDGLHAGRFYQKVQELLDHPESL